MWTVLNGLSALNARKQFLSGIFAMLIVLIVSDNRVDGRTVEMKSYKDIMNSETMVQCQSACIEYFLLNTENLVELPKCQEHSNCAMCFDFCETLFVVERQTFKSMCTSYFCVSSPIQ